MSSTKQRIKDLEAALAWYATEDNWKRRATHKAGEPVQWVKSDAAHDRGKRARLALKRAANHRQFGQRIRQLLTRRQHIATAHDARPAASDTE